MVVLLMCVYARHQHQNALQLALFVTESSQCTMISSIATTMTRQ